MPLIESGMFCMPSTCSTVPRVTWTHLLWKLPLLQAVSLLGLDASPTCPGASRPFCPLSPPVGRDADFLFKAVWSLRVILHPMQGNCEQKEKKMEWMELENLGCSVPHQPCSLLALWSECTLQYKQRKLSYRVRPLVHIARYWQWHSRASVYDLSYLFLSENL